MNIDVFNELHHFNLIKLLVALRIFKSAKEANRYIRHNYGTNEELQKLKDKLSDVFNEPKWATGESGVYTLSFDTVEAPSVKEFKQLKKDHKALVKRVEELEGNKKRAAIAMESYWTKEYPDSPMAKYYNNKE